MPTAFPHYQMSGYSGTNGWAHSGISTGVNAQAIMDADLARMVGAIDVRIYSWYPPESIVGAGTYPESLALDYSTKHFTSPYCDDVKATYYISGDWAMDPTYLVQNAQWIAAQMASPCWARYRDQPILAIYDPVSMATTYLASWNTFKTYLPGGLYIVAMGGAPSPTNLTDIGANTFVRYGPNGASIPGNGQHSRAEQITVDQATWGATGSRDVGCTMTLGADHRAQSGDPNGNSSSWADSPLIAEWMAFYRACPYLYPRVIYSGSEFSEGWPNLVGSAQRPNMYTDATRYARLAPGDTGIPTDYVDRVDLRQQAFTSVGTTAPTWTYGVLNAPIAGAFDSDEIILSDTNARMQSVNFPRSTRIRFWGRGSFTVGVDTTSPATAVSGTDLYDVASGPIFDSGALTEGDHYITIQGVDGNSRADVVFVNQNLRALP